MILFVDINLSEDYEFWKRAIYSLLGDFFLLFSPYWFISNRYKWTSIFPILFLSFFFIVNIWYFRFWDNFLPTTSLHATKNINGMLLNSIRGLVKASDLIFLFPSAIILTYICFFNKKLKREIPLRIKCKWIFFVASLTAFLFFQFIRIEKARRWYQNDFELRLSYKQMLINDLNNPVFNSIHYFNTNGIIFYMIRFFSDYVKISNIRQELSEEELKTIREYLNSHNNCSTPNFFENNKTKNIIFIIVESLNAYVINKEIEGKEITPFMNSLLHEQGTIYSLNVETQVRDGRSGDGQFIYNTGLLPLNGFLTPMMVVPNIKLPVLSDNYKGYLSRDAVFADDGRSWNQSDNFKIFGFSNVYAQDSGDSHVLLRGSDGAMFDKAIDLIKKAKKPFFMEIVSISMHVPFQDPGVPSFDWLQQIEMSKNDRNYLRMTTYFDQELQKFVAKLKDIDLYENTILILASDHSQNITVDKSEKINDVEIPIVFIATNTGLSKRIETKKGQIDVFPTILEITGHFQDIDYSGVGFSMLDSVNNSLDRIEEIQNISDLIIRGNYFHRINRH
ncbi:MAG: sulfatase-like hydrolase/transferase [Muribaculaceae bacterium]|nr:sulfatase-like hydrolase/transferase [Muribaculaceae bacterium]